MENPNQNLTVVTPTGILLKVDLQKSTAFSSKMGEIIANLLIQHLVRTEPVENWDECIADLLDKLSMIVNKMMQCPVEAFFLAEVEKKIMDRVKQHRYSVSIQEERLAS